MDDVKEGHAPAAAGVRRKFEVEALPSGIMVPAYSACSADDADVQREFHMRVELKDKTYGTDAGVRNCRHELERIEIDISMQEAKMESFVIRWAKRMRALAVKRYCVNHEMRTHNKQHKELRTEKLSSAEAVFAAKQAMKKLKEEARKKHEALKVANKPVAGGRKRKRLAGMKYIDDEAEEVDVSSTDGSDDDHQ